MQQQYVVTNPDFYPNLPPLGGAGGFQSTQVIQEISSRLRAPYIMQSAVTVERQLPRNTTLAVTYTNSHGLHVLRSEDINAPLPGTYNPAVQDSGVFPLGHPGAVDPDGIVRTLQPEPVDLQRERQTELAVFRYSASTYSIARTAIPMASGRFRPTRTVSPGEYGPAATDIRHRVTIGGSINLKWARPHQPVRGDAIGRALRYHRRQRSLRHHACSTPARASRADPNKPGLIQTSYGLLDPNPRRANALLSRNFGRGPGQIQREPADRQGLRVRRTTRGAAVADPAAPAIPMQAATGRGLGGLIGTPTTSHRFNLSIGLSIRNLLNHTNPGPILATSLRRISDSRTRSPAGKNGEGFYETANNRRLESQIKFTF